MTEVDTSRSKRYTVPEAAKVLGIGTDAVRKRIARDTISHEKEADGRVYVYLDTGHDEGHDAQEPSPEQVKYLREQIGYLQGVIATRDEELRTRAEELRRRDQDLERRDRIIAALTERIPQALEPPSGERESPRTVEEDSAESGGARQADPADVRRRPAAPPRRPVLALTLGLAAVVGAGLAYYLPDLAQSVSGFYEYNRSASPRQQLPLPPFLQPLEPGSLWSELSTTLPYLLFALPAILGFWYGGYVMGVGPWLIGVKETPQVRSLLGERLFWAILRIFTQPAHDESDTRVGSHRTWKYLRTLRRTLLHPFVLLSAIAGIGAALVQAMLALRLSRIVFPPPIKIKIITVQHPLEDIGIFVITFLFVLFGAILGAANWRSKYEYEATRSSSQDNEADGKAWTVREQTLFGLAGTLITALFAFLGILVQVWWN